jgi:hypothetical protein
MDAKLVWDTWRRLLTDDGLVAWINNRDSRGTPPPGLSADETAILVEYSATPPATRSNIGMYRRGLIRNALGALELLPLSRNLLRASDLDDDATAKRFSKASVYHDYGPRFWGAAADFVNFLAGLPEFASRAHQDVLTLDRATAGLALRLGSAKPAMWPAIAITDGGGRADQVGAPPVRFLATAAAAVVPTSCDITPWIVSPFDFDPADPLDLAPQHIVVYFPTAEAAPEYALVSARAARVFEALSTPHDTHDVSAAVDGLSPADAEAVVGELTALGVVAAQAGLPETTAAR